jgi:hypothetical protein
MAFKNEQGLQGKKIRHLPLPDALEMKYVFQPRGGTDA